MNYKIVETDKKYPNVLLYLDEDNDGIPRVYIHVVGFDEAKEEVIQWAEVIFDTFQECRNFIKDYSKESAEAFCDLRKIYSYEYNPEENEKI